ncbi:MAG: class I tRNA ligase family protein, partial [Sciscionella sp.]
FGCDIVRTVDPGEGFAGGAFTGEGPAINSGFLNGMGVQEAKTAMIAWLAQHDHGEGTVVYKLRDWLFARQRYWGEPFPIVYDEQDNPIALGEDQLPVQLPEVDDYAPSIFDPDDADSVPSPPLAKATDWVEVTLDLGEGEKKYRRDTNVMPQWAGSCWYQLRYVDPTNTQRFCDPANERYWMGPRPEEHGAADPGGIDLYVGGVEHAVLHLLYARFWHKVLFDLGHVSSNEPYRRLVNQGYIEAYAYVDARGSYVPAQKVTETAQGYTYQGEPVEREYGKMGKSLKNAISPDEMYAEYGADTFRFYEMSMGPFGLSRPWATKDVIGAHRFLQRLWRNAVDEDTGELRLTDSDPGEDDLRALHRAIAGTREDYAALRFNTAGAKLIEFNNYLTKKFGKTQGTPRQLMQPLVRMLAPLCPHIAEELHARLGHESTVVTAAYPVAEQRYLVSDTVEYPIQVNGKVRARVVVAADADTDAVSAAALAEGRIVDTLGGQVPRKVIVVPGRLVNLVV